MNRITGLSAITVMVLGAALARAQGSAGEHGVPDETPDAVRGAVESENRPAEDRARDVNRKPAEILAMSGVGPGDHVIELAGFGQYYTRLLVEIVGADGLVEVYDLPYTDEFAGEASRAFANALDNVEYHQVNYNDAEFPSGVDVIFNILYYHDLRPNEIDTAELNANLYDALAPGGRYVIVDHKAEPGSGWRDAGTIHRIGVQTIVDEVTQAGFELAIDSDILANPEDDRSEPVFAEGTRGTTDRAVLVFEKPE